MDEHILKVLAVEDPQGSEDSYAVNGYLNHNVRSEREHGF